VTVLIDKEKIKKAVRLILEAIGEDPERPGLRETPQRVADIYEEILSGYTDQDELVGFEHFANMVILRNVRFYSLCEHHILPFYGSVDIVYVPNNAVIGVSKIVRIVQKYARRLQVQEKMTTEIADEIFNSEYKPKGVLVMSRAKHMCMIMRGVKNPSVITSIVYRGIFETDNILRSQAMMLLARNTDLLEVDIFG